MNSLNRHMNTPTNKGTEDLIKGTDGLIDKGTSDAIFQYGQK